MIEAKQVVSYPALKIAEQQAKPVRKVLLYPVKVEEKLLRAVLVKQLFNPEPGPDPSFDQWNLPPQEERYIKGREHDFL